ncbi:MAG: ATP-binding protein [Ginsengibacter sp.]
MKKKISSVEIQHFRGIPKSLKIDLWKKSPSSPNSVIIFGDNGTGKSSIIDALELGLQAQIQRNRNLKSELKASPISLKSFGDSKIKITFQDSSEIERQINVNEDIEGYYLKLDNGKVHPHFRITPIVLRRNDILRFIETPSHQRQILFFSYIRDLEKQLGNDKTTEEKLEINAEKVQLKNKRRNIAALLAKEIGIPVDDIPISPASFDLFMSEKIYGGINKQRRETLSRKGFRLQTNEKAVTLAKDIKKITEKIQSLSKRITGNKNPHNPQETTQKKLAAIFSDAGEYLTESFKKISSSNFFDKIEMRVGDITQVSLDLMVHLKNGRKVQPNNIFSEANLDLLALLVFLSIIQEAAKNGQEKVLILDDVLQSVDSTIRLMFVDFLLKTYPDWQLIFSVHDRLFLNQLKTIFRRYSHDFVEIEILKWDFENGPFIIKKDTEIDNSLFKAIETNDINLITSQAGILLEKICNHLSYSLPISVTRKLEDKYTLGDLWPGVFKKLKKTEIHETLEIIDKLSFLRNLFGAHYNEWAASLSNSEALQYANSVNTFYESTFCDSCLTWISNNSTIFWKCSCGKCSLAIS